MPILTRDDYTKEEHERFDAKYAQLLNVIKAAAPDAEEFRRVLDDALASGFPIDFVNLSGTLLLYTMRYPPSVRAGLPQILINAGADVNVWMQDGITPFHAACWRYIENNLPEYLPAIDAMLAAGDSTELTEGWFEGWKAGWSAPAFDADNLSRRARLAAYIETSHERRAKDRAEGASPAFDYAL